MSDENVNETVKSIEQNAKWMTLNTYYYTKYENMLLISMYYFYCGSGTSVLNSKINKHFTGLC